MKAAPIPENENARLKELISYQIMDTDPEVNFDDITELASQICQTPIALVSLIDEKRQWFKSHHGLDATETSRDISFCGHAIHQSDVFEVPNALEDQRFEDNPLATGEPRVIFYAGYPLRSANEFNLGTLCVIDHQPRRLTDAQKRGLQILGRQTIAQMELRLKNQKLRESIKKIQEQAETLEEQRAKAIHQTKMASLGIMAGGISHEINNPLAIISMTSLEIQKLISLDQLSPEEITKRCEKIDNTTKRISSIIKGLRALARNTSKDPLKTESVQDIVENTLNVCREKMKSNGVKIFVEGDSKIQASCRGGEISQVLLNLISNSFDAIESCAQKWIKIQFSNEENVVKISVTDSGSGIAQEQQDKVMIPFYTTKPVGEGTGLGLSISRSLIAAHSGELTLDSSSKNTKFDILLPQEPIGC